MNKDTAIKLLNMYLELNPHRHDLRTAIETILKELDKKCVRCGKEIKETELCDDCTFHLASETTEELVKRYEKGYYDGFRQAKFDIEMDKINEGEV